MLLSRTFALIFAIFFYGGFLAFPSQCLAADMKIKSFSSVATALNQAAGQLAGRKGSNAIARVNGGVDNTVKDGPGNEVLAFKIEEANGKTTAYITASGSIEHNAFTLSNPDRLVVNLKGVTPGNLKESLPLHFSIVQRVRTALFSKEPLITRLVFDLSGRAIYKTDLSSDQKKFTIQIYSDNMSNLLSGKVIAIDPGHGGDDPGAIGPTGLKEKEVTMDVAKRTASLLQERGAKVILTRSGDEYVGLHERTEKANRAGAAIFISIHMNANEDASICGTSTYVYGDGSDWSTDPWVQRSKELALNIQSNLVHHLGLSDKGIREANFAVLRTSDVPAVLIEGAFISNPEEEKIIAKDEFRRLLAQAIINGIERYFTRISL
ncbi:MAG: N-acetylmuramoyl-L-alanine amidase [Peptococcaceae bacterium]|nr:MAG: N-acetylmuramoyl-L-alanine amidase [Peptococcaceae bacterium]